MDDRPEGPLAVVMLDMDRFKLLNDTYGHLVGDQVLRYISESLTVVLQETAAIGRCGGWSIGAGSC